MTTKSITLNRLTSTGRMNSKANSSGGLRGELLGRMDVSMMADGADLIGNIAAKQGGWWFDHSGATLNKYTENGVPYVRGVYPSRVGGGVSWPSVWFDFPNGAAPQEYYFQFEARRDGSIQSCSKFVKCYGGNGGAPSYSNTTWNNGYTSSSVSTISFGNGAGLTNDTQNVISYETGHDDEQATRYPSVPANVRTKSIYHGGSFDGSEWGNGTQWKKWRFRIKVNTGTSPETEINDGIFEVWVDGVQRVGAYNIMNRHYSSSFFSKMEFLSYMQDNLGFTLDMRNITISKYDWVD